MITIIEDTGQKIGQHDLKNQHMKDLGAKVIRSKLLVGDYMLASGGSISVDTKQDMSEMYGNIIQDHVRLSNEIKLAKECNIKLIFLIEHGEGFSCIDDVLQWKNPQVEKYRFKVRAVLLKLKLVTKFCKYTLDELLLIAKINNAKIPKPPAPNEQLVKSMNTLIERYGCEFLFCTKDETGKRIIELLGGE
jgi:hypothetical protein